MKRFGMIIGLKAAKVKEYKQIHAAVWPDVLKIIRQYNIRNYSIFLHKIAGRHYLFSYFEYAGKDFSADMGKMAAEPMTQKWWELCMPCQTPVPIREPGEWWANMEEVFHLE